MSRRHCVAAAADAVPSLMCRCTMGVGVIVGVIVGVGVGVGVGV